MGPRRGQKRSRDEARVIGNIRLLHSVFMENKPVSFDIPMSHLGATDEQGSKILIKKVLTIPEMRAYIY